MKLKNLRLNISNVARTSSAETLPVNDVGTIYNPEVQEREVTGYTISCSVYRGDELKIKLPVNVADKIMKARALLDDDMEIHVRFTGLKLRAYAMKNESGGLISGVSASADDFEIVDLFDESIDIEN